MLHASLQLLQLPLPLQPTCCLIYACCLIPAACCLLPLPLPPTPAIADCYFHSPLLPLLPLLLSGCCATGGCACTAPGQPLEQLQQLQSGGAGHACTRCL
jgi:hypothetical protein